MNPSWYDYFLWGLMIVIFPILMYFSLRDIIRFGRRVRQNRKEGVYNDPEFKWRIRRLNIWRYTVVVIELLLGAAAIWAITAGIRPEVVFPAWGVIFAPCVLAGVIVELRWRRLMSRGIE